VVSIEVDQMASDSFHFVLFDNSCEVQVVFDALFLEMIGHFIRANVDQER
jgi:hypothetical protein